ncbi:hypothetical protein IQ251_09025 [Saccharopolyspora sp. HNM0983]|uniref:Uncharacterized protein n=1 Tax=Saccharopolyspora montiporae TaxID=2781240 RepID=A0A929BA26_9PSEU|nr:hypothetical protein [Saccharopolyspora sp. HNM0983]MBE9374590.1 hypothetical protein [Saccharopolyspora sp. HNM0983]
MIAPLRRLVRRLSGGGVPDGFAGELAADEHVLASARTADGGVLLASRLGVWLPEGRRVGWHLLSKVSWNSGSLSVIEAEEVDAAGEAVLLRDLPARRFRLAEPGRIPQVLRERVDGSIRSRDHRELPGGGVWVVQRKVPGRDGVLLQVRPDPGTDEAAVRRVAAEVADRVRRAREAR